ncbi:TldD/PmbA family protein [Methanohalophilus sp.]|uniref:TldD/PmbA family protein n=1 Tax=Methanohalophilus sp. TaxID=1966352 RepID=UPI002602CFF7|nr:TldD/PmbA family protein [Methanohalophilus sp.]MDK2892397.1 PmbA protein [Methanohalophilus sp.]
MDYYDIADKALKTAEELGANEAEIYIFSGKSTCSDIRKNSIESAHDKHSLGIGVRCIINGAVGFASTNLLGDIETTVQDAVAAAKVMPDDPDWICLPSNKQYNDVKGLFSVDVADLSLGDCILKTKEMIEGVSSVDGILATSGSFSRSIGSHLIMNSNGVEVEEKSTAITGFIDVITTGNEVSTAYDFAVSRDLDIDFYGLGKRAATLASDSINGIEIKGGKKDVVFHPFALADLIENAFVPSIDADNVQKGRSSLIDKIGENIASDSLSIYDDGTLEGGLGSSISDDEGVPSQKTCVIGNGVLESYLYDSYTAGKAGVESTGNGIRNSYASLPRVGTTNLLLDYDCPSPDIIPEIDEGVFINTVIGAHTANQISGDFSVEARNAFVIEKGEITSPVKSLMISGNIFDILSRIQGAGNDVKKVGGIVLPSIWASELNVVV